MTGPFFGRYPPGFMFVQFIDIFLSIEVKIIEKNTDIKNVVRSIEIFRLEVTSLFFIDFDMVDSM